MKILYISYNGALEPLLQSQGIPYIMGVHRNGHQFHIMTFEPGKSIGRRAPAFLNMKNSLSGAGISWTPLHFHSWPGFIAKAYDLLTGAVVSFILSVKFKPDAIHARGLFSALVALPAASVLKKPVIFDMRSKLSEAYAISGKWRDGGAVSRLMSSLEDRCLRRAAAVIVETTEHKREVEEFLAGNRTRKPVEVIPCCVDLERFKDARKIAGRAPEFMIAYLGSLSGWYCLEETVRFFEKLSRTIPGSKMIFLTKDDPKSILKYLKDSNIPDGAVTITGVAPGMVPERLARSTAGILFKYPNRRLSSFPVKIGEYLAAGIPVIINRGMGDVEDFVLGNGVGVAVDGFDDGAFDKGIAALIALAKDKDIVEKCFTAARKLSTEIGVQKYLGVYELIERKTAA
ncbi:MAG: glycosyltransferase [Candidatus Omnitrophota bacterium]